jgi:Amt family ammonium transporter
MEQILLGFPRQLRALSQAVAVGFVIVFVFVGSFVVLKVLDKISPLGVSPEEEEKGLVQSQHGKDAYSEET